MSEDVERVPRDELNLSRREVMCGSALATVTAINGVVVGGALAQSDPSNEISGTVTDVDGNAVDGATVIAVPHDNTLDPLVTTTDANGAYSFLEADLYSGDNLYHVVARNGTQSSPQRSQENYPFLQANGGLPDSVVGHWPGDEGSGTTLIDNEGSNDITLNGPTWQSVSRFAGDWGISFDRTDDSASGSLLQPSQFTWIIRVAADNLTEDSPVFRYVISHNQWPSLLYNVSADEWQFNIDDLGQNVVSDPQSTVESEDRILVARFDSGTAELDVYNGSKSSVGANSSTGRSLAYGSATTYLGDQGNGSRYWGGLMDPQFYQFNARLTDKEVNNVLSSEY